MIKKHVIRNVSEEHGELLKLVKGDWERLLPSYEVKSWATKYNKDGTKAEIDVFVKPKSNLVSYGLPYDYLANRVKIAKNGKETAFEIEYGGYRTVSASIYRPFDL